MTEIYAKLFGKNFENFKFLYTFTTKIVDIRWMAPVMAIIVVFGAV